MFKPKLNINPEKEKNINSLSKERREYLIRKAEEFTDELKPTRKEKYARINYDDKWVYREALRFSGEEEMATYELFD
jgi:mRNA-degrading endonuclease RelE of RelBE toxin-antitoxin system